jgi:hypothetical protein
MARKKPARPAKKAKKQAKKKTASKAAARRGAKKPAKKAAKKKANKKKASKPAKSARAKASARRAAPAKKAAPTSANAPAKPRKAASAKKPNLDRPRKTVADIHGIPSSLDLPRAASSAKSGRADMKDRLAKNTGSGPALTAGDVDADWESAESVGDEAPGGDNPTPDQDVVDDIGRALGVEYDDDEELQGGAEILDRDRHRWELDPASKDIDEDDE